MNEDKDIGWQQDQQNLEEFLKSVSEEDRNKFREMSLSIQSLIELTKKIRQRNENKRNSNRNIIGD